jgi:5-(carboxyamino)imidazole ribonucleotide mutase
VATVALNGAKNAGILAAQIIGVKDAAVRDRISAYKASLTDQVMVKVAKMEAK